MALRFRGSGHFRLRLACATLSGRTIRIDDIRARDENPGLRDYEASLLRLLEKVTNGCVVEINETGAAGEQGVRLVWKDAHIHPYCTNSARRFLTCRTNFVQYALKVQAWQRGRA